MYSMGQKRTFWNVRPMSTLPPKANIHRRERHVRFEPQPDAIVGWPAIGVTFATTRNSAARRFEQEAL